MCKVFTYIHTYTYRVEWQDSKISQPINQWTYTQPAKLCRMKVGR